MIVGLVVIAASALVFLVRFSPARQSEERQAHGLLGLVTDSRSLSNNSFLKTKNATQYPAYSNLDFVVELSTSLHSPNYAYRLEYCLSDRLLANQCSLLGVLPAFLKYSPLYPGDSC